MASRRYREYREAQEAKHYDRWQQERDEDLSDDELPERDEPEPVHTLQ
jgi:hypothetical protein